MEDKNKSKIKIDKDKVVDKWSTLSEGMSDEKSGWLKEYAEMNELAKDDPIWTAKQEKSEDDDFPSLFPIIKKVAAQTIGQNLVSVKPMEFESEEERIKRETKIREDKIDALMKGIDFKLTEDHEPKHKSPVVDLMYFDYIYGDDEDEEDDTEDDT